MCRIFVEYAGGSSARLITARLNREGVRAPRALRWNASTINGNRHRGSGILLNQLYIGPIVWGKVEMVRDPKRPAKRLSRPNDMEQRQAAEYQAHLRIIDQEAWDAVQGRKARNAGGSCTNRSRYYLDEVQRIVVDGMRTQLRDPEVIQVFVRTFNEERKRLAASSSTDRARIEKRLAILDGQHARLIDGVADGILPRDDVADKLSRIRLERNDLNAELAAINSAAKVVTLHPSAIDQYLATVDRLSEFLTAVRDDDDYRAAIDQFSALVECVIVGPAEDIGFQVRVHGGLAALVGADVFPEARHVVSGEIVGSGGGT